MIVDFMSQTRGRLFSLRSDEGRATVLDAPRPAAAAEVLQTPVWRPGVGRRLSEENLVGPEEGEAFLAGCLETYTGAMFWAEARGDEAVENKFVSDKQRKWWFANQGSKKGAKGDKPSPSDLQAVKTYSQSGFDYSYAYVNTWLRSEELQGSMNEAGMKKAVAALDRVLDASVTDKPTTLYRGTGWREYGIEPEDVNESLVGKVLQDRAYTSTTADRELAQEAYSYDRPILRIKVPAGSRVLDMEKHAAIPEEREFLLARGARYRVDRVVNEGGKVVEVTLLDDIIENAFASSKQRRWYFANLAADKATGGGGGGGYKQAGSFKEAAAWAKERGVQQLPTKTQEAVELITGGVAASIAKMQKDNPDFFKDNPPPPQNEIAANYTKELRSRKSTWNGKAALTDLSPELMTEAQNAINANSLNGRFQGVVEKMGPQRVVVRHGEKSGRGAAEYRGGVTYVFDDDSVRNLDLKQREKYAGSKPTPEPGKFFHMTETEGLESTLRHEYGHQVMDFLGRTKQREFQQIYNRLGQNKIKEGLTTYAAANHDELFAETFALITHPKYKRAAYPDWVGELDDTITGWVNDYAKGK